MGGSLHGILHNWTLKYKAQVHNFSSEVKCMYMKYYQQTCLF